MHDNFLRLLTTKIEADERSKAAWLEGSFLLSKRYAIQIKVTSKPYQQRTHQWN